MQSRKRFPKEGKIVATSLGEEKVLAIDIFRERLTLRGVEGETRSLTLAEFREEMERPAGEGGGATTIEEDSHAEVISPDEISPELLYTSEHGLSPSGVVRCDGSAAVSGNLRRRANKAEEAAVACRPRRR